MAKMAIKSSLFIFATYLCICCFFNGSSQRDMESWFENYFQDSDPPFECPENPSIAEFRCKPSPWHQIVKTKKLELFDAQDWKNHEALISYLPQYYSNRVNLSDQTISILGKHKLKKTVLENLAERLEEHKRRVLHNEQEILKLGNIFCGFSALHMSRIPSEVLRSLYRKNFFQTLRGCAGEKIVTLLITLQEKGIVGLSKTWNPETVTRLGILVSGCLPEDFRKIRLQSMSYISPEVIKLTHPDTLKGIYIDQLRSLSRESLLQWRRSTKDSRPIYAKSTRFSANVQLIILSSILPNYVHLNI